ncbi:MAG: glycerol-3-phosphate acyltransferase [Anaerolineales bacterium]
MSLFVLLSMAAAYLIGSIPMGYVIVKAITGQDVRQVGSGRTGGTNAMRAAGLAAGLLTALLDMLKGAAGVWLAKAILPNETQALGMALAGLCVILGHNHSIFLGFKGGAGGGPAVGAAMAMWPWSALIVIPIGVAVFYFVGYASVTTIAAGVTITALFAYRTFVLRSPGAEAEYVLYGVGAIFLLVWALRPNLKRLLRGEERLHGFRAKWAKQAGTGESSSHGK